MPDRIALITSQFQPISLEEINRRAALQTRADNKYFLPWSRFSAFVELLHRTHVILEIDGQRAFTYDTQYFDTVDLGSYWDHVQKRRKRFKCRSRRYVDNGQSFFEIKLKSGRGETVKYKIEYRDEDWGLVTPTAASFLEECLRGSYGVVFTEPLMPTLRTLYQRMTLAAADGTERITCDFNLAFGANNRWQGRMAPDYVLVETKSSRGRGAADKLLWSLGARPTSGSKYCLGLSLVQPTLRSNPFQYVRKHYFVREGEPGAEQLPAEPVASPTARVVGDTRVAAHLPLPSTASILFE
ncbi:MAG TPA: polyphosphate polymerase domain-containing protein [Rhodocyclaceae bacterium]|nr:polyphosphate polymerase domain-containing protein [Rhodocyclaceae bacterium]